MAENFGYNSTTDDVLTGIDLTGKRVLVTGASAGLGVETCRALVAHGADVVGAARNLAKAEQATGVVREAAAGGTGRFALIELDLASLASVRRCAADLLAKGENFDVVIANAGVMMTPFEHTADGFETQFGTNHLGHFVFVNAIVPLLGDNGRVVVLSSAGHRFADVDLEDPGFAHGAYDPAAAYGRSKTANILFAVEFDRRHRAAGVRATAVHPGAIQGTELVRHLSTEKQQGMIDSLNQRSIAASGTAFQFKTVPQGAATSVWAAVVAPADMVGGHYCEDCHIAELVVGDASGGARAYALDPHRATALWTLSEAMVGQAF